MIEKNWYLHSAQLVDAIGQSWFSRTLQSVLQPLFHYDHFLFVYYRQGRAFRVLSSDFRTHEACRALHWLETETYVVEPIYLLFKAGEQLRGVCDMASLVTRAHTLAAPPSFSSGLPHLIEDASEEIGWRTMGWPRYQQETCILFPLGQVELVAVSLYNAGLEREGPQSASLLDRVYPLIAAIVFKHSETVEGRRWGSQTPSGDKLNDLRGTLGPIDIDSVSLFFRDSFHVRLTAREAEVFARLLKGTAVPLIAAEIHMTPNTVRTHRRNVYRRLGEGSLPELINRYHVFIKTAHHPQDPFQSNSAA